MDPDTAGAFDGDGGIVQPPSGILQTQSALVPRAIVLDDDIDAVEVVPTVPHLRIALDGYRGDVVDRAFELEVALGNHFIASGFVPPVGGPHLRVVTDDQRHVVAVVRSTDPHPLAAHRGETDPGGTGLCADLAAVVIVHLAVPPADRVPLVANHQALCA